MQPIKIFNYTPVTRLRFKSLHANHWINRTEVLIDYLINSDDRSYDNVHAHKLAQHP